MVNNDRFNAMDWLYFMIVTVAAAWLRIWFVLAVPTEQLFDFKTYQEIAVNVFNEAGHVYQGMAIAWQGPAYPLVLGHVYRLFGDSDVLIGKYFNVALSVMTLVMLFFLLRRFSGNRFFVYGSYALAAFLPNYLAYNNVIGTEVFFTFLFMLILLLQVYYFNDWLRIPLLGILIGVAALTKPFFIAYPFVAALYFWFKAKDIKSTALVLGALLLITAAVVAPWTYRNYRVYGEFIPVSYNSGYVLYINNNDVNVTGRWMDLQDVPAAPELERKIGDILDKYDGQVQLAYELDELLKGEAYRWIGENPLEFLKMGFFRLQETYFMGAWDVRSWAMNEVPSTLDPQEDVAYRRSLSLFHTLSDVLIYVLSSFGLVYMLVNLIPVARASRWDINLPDRILIPTINLAFFVLVVFIFEGQARYNYPVLFLLIIGMFATLEAKQGDGSFASLE